MKARFIKERLDDKVQCTSWPVWPLKILTFFYRSLANEDFSDGLRETQDSGLFL